VPVPAPPQPPGGSTPTGRPPLLTVRSAVIFLIAIVTGTTVGFLTYVSAVNLATAVVAGMVIAGSTALGAHSVVD
jgi:hypothetical protein